MSADTDDHAFLLCPEIRDEVEEIRCEVKGTRKELQDLSMRVDGIFRILSRLAGRSHNLEKRVEKLESALNVSKAPT